MGSSSPAPELDALYASVYTELVRLARLKFSRASATLDTSALISEAYLKLHGKAGTGWINRQHVRAVACNAMRQVVCNHLRDRRREKRGGVQVAVTLDGLAETVSLSPEQVLDLDQALERLAAASPRQATVVEMRCFGGFTVEEIAETLGVGSATVKRDWATASLFLKRHLDEARRDSPPDALA